MTTPGAGAIICPKCGHVIVEAPPRALTERQAQILRFVQEEIDVRGVPPTFDEIAIHFGYKSLATVNEHLNHLAAKGWIRRAFNVNRGIELLHRVPLQPSTPPTSEASP